MINGKLKMENIQQHSQIDAIPVYLTVRNQCVSDNVLKIRQFIKKIIT